MPEIDDAVNFAIAQSGKPYHAYGDRFGLDYYDCSGLVIRSLYEAHIPLGPGISVENKTGNTVSLYNWAKGVGGLVSVSQGVSTKGAVMIKGKWYGYGPLGHTSISLGDGREMAAHGRRTGIGISTLDAGFYQDAFIIPGVHYGPPIPPWKVQPQMTEHLNARLYNKQTKGWFDGYPDGRVDYLAPDGKISHGGMVSASDKQAFAGRTLALLEDRWYIKTNGVHTFGFTIVATSGERYVPEAQH